MGEQTMCTFVLPGGNVISYHAYMLPLKYTWQLQNFLHSCPLNTSTAIATATKQHKHAKSLPLMYTDEQTLYNMSKYLKEE
jgi:hypothetical protein